MYSKTPKNCSECRGQQTASTIIRKFVKTDYGHLSCRKCRISFDSNVNETIDASLDEERITRIQDEKTYRDLFIEAPRISTQEGEIYAKFDWDDNENVKAGVASHVVNSLKKHHLDELSQFVDVGCGDGFTSVQIAKQFPEAKIVAIDPSPLVAKLASHSSIIPYQGILQNAPLQPSTVDALAVIGNWMLHTNPVNTIEKAFEVLRPGGTLVIDYKNIRSTTRVLAGIALKIGIDRFAMKNWLQRNFINMRFGYNKQSVQRILDDAGFETLETYGKPPRLLEFKNKSQYQRGVAGMIWRCLDGIDRVRDEQAWIHVVCRKPN